MNCSNFLFWFFWLNSTIFKSNNFVFAENFRLIFIEQSLSIFSNVTCILGPWFPHVPQLPLWSWGSLGDFELHFHLALHLLILNMIYGVILHMNQEGHRKPLATYQELVFCSFLSLSLKWESGRWHIQTKANFSYLATAYHQGSLAKLLFNCSIPLWINIFPYLDK